MGQAGQFLIGLATLIGGAGLTIWFVWHSVKKSDDPGRLLTKWIATGIVFGILVFLGASAQGAGYGGAFMIPAAGAAFGVVLGIIWAPNLGALIAKPFTSFYDGGDAEPEVRPLYSMAKAKRNRGNYKEALAAVRTQLERFPEDFEGWMLLAEINARDLKDNAAAQECIDQVLSHPHHTPKNITFALNCSADWHLSLASDRDSAAAALEKIVLMFPETEFAHAAAQRLAHLSSDKMLAESKDRPRIALTHYDEHIGLRGEVADPRPPEESPAEIASRLVAHLNEHPEDVEARESLAKIYADHYQRMDLASDQIEQLMALPGVGQREIAHWLNLLVDFHVRVSQDKTAAEEALRRIIERFPNSAVAAKAETRIVYLDTEMRRNEKSQAVKLGSYEDNIGLKGRVPKSRV